MHAIYAESHECRRWSANTDRAWLKRQLLETRTTITKLTPAGRRMLARLHELFESTGYGTINRAQIARALGRPGGLTVWDRRLLERLAKAGFITRRRTTLPKTLDRRGVLSCRGSEFRYTMDINTGWRLAVLKRAGKESRREH